MKISIAMATYNGERFIGEQLDSIAAQSRLPDELVVNDDCSSDGTERLVREFAKTAPFAVEFARNGKNLGFDGNFAAALGKCSGDIIFISDQDDIWHADKVRRVADHFAEHQQALAVVHDQYVMDSGGRRLPLAYAERLRRIGYSRADQISGNLTALRREALELALPFLDTMHYDAWIALLLDCLEARAFLDAPLQDYRRHDGNATGSAVEGERVSFLGTFLKTGRRNPSNELELRADGLSTAAERIDRQRSMLEGRLGADAVARAHARALRRSAALGGRAGLLSLRRTRRPAAIVKAWREGIYREFSGLRSAVIDAFRP